MNCLIEDCNRIAHARGWCGLHYQRWLNHGDPLIIKRKSGHKEKYFEKECSVESCLDTVRTKGFCKFHYNRWSRTGNPLTTPTGAQRGTRRVGVLPCKIEECNDVWYAKEMCKKHYSRTRRWGDPLKTQKPNLGKGRYTKEGYILIYYPNHPNANGDGYVREHRKVMSDYLGRPLEAYEIVHHKNGIRSDNRIENLELLTRITHPTGHEHQICPSCGERLV